jgi:phosphoenolpyruvate carboxykinase (ATP)
MVHHPFHYADLLSQKMTQHKVNCWLVNTGWTGGPFGVGKRFSIHHTRALLNAALDGRLLDVKYRKDKLFGFEVPTTCPDVPPDVLDPSSTWGNKEDYWKRYDALAARYIDNFKQFKDGCTAEVAAAGPKRMSHL